MSNNKRSMKLYTEEQVLNALKLAHSHIKPLQYVIDTLTPIELPSDEEIKKTMTDFDEFDPDDVAYLGGAIWMRNKIQGG